MYELEDVSDIRSHSTQEGYLTLVTFNDGLQYCSCCDVHAIDYHPDYDERLDNWEAEGGFLPVNDTPKRKRNR